MSLSQLFYAALPAMSGQGTPEAQDALLALDMRFPFVPLSSPGMPMPGPNFAATAVALGDQQPTVRGSGRAASLEQCGPYLQFLYRRALYDPQFSMLIDAGGGLQTSVRTVPGHLIGLQQSTLEFMGPRPSRVMIVGKHPGMEELQHSRNLVGPTARTFYDALHGVNIPEEDFRAWYATNVVRWMPPQVRDSLPRPWVADCSVLLEQELRLVRPDHILCLGAEAARAVADATGAVTDMVGKIYRRNIRIGTQPDGAALLHEAKVSVAWHPAYVFRRPELMEEFQTQLLQFYRVTQGVEPSRKEVNVRQESIYSAQRLDQIIQEIQSDPDPWRRFISVDCEWEGSYPQQAGAYLRTVQFSTAHGEGFCVVLRHQGGQPAFYPSIDSAIERLRRLLTINNGWRPRIGGWFLRADLPWLRHAGIDCREAYAPDLNDPRNAGGWAGEIAYHAVRETAAFGLESVAARLTTVPRYDLTVDEWLRAYAKHHKRKISGHTGFGHVPDEVLHGSYAPYDADAARRIGIECFKPGGLLDNDGYGHDCWAPYAIAHRASLGFLEMEESGIEIDRERLHELTLEFMETKQRKLQELQRMACWSEFNPGSTEHCVALIFGPQYLHKPFTLPEGVTPLGLTPIKSTGKKSKLWSAVVAGNLQRLYTPATDKETLGILGQRHPLVRAIRDFKFILQATRTTLRPPNVEEDGRFETDDDEDFVYEKGLGSFCRPSGRVHTRLSQLKETGRSSSSKPNLQAVSKRREDDYRRIIGPDRHQHCLRSVFRASPGHVLVEADYKTAEVAVLAWLSGDPQMIEDVQRSMLPEDHPDYFDIHSSMAVRAFNLTCAPTKSALKAADCSSLRVAAKNVIFGIPYGRGDEAIARQCMEEGNDVSEDQAGAIRAYYFERYRHIQAFLEVCQERSQNERCVCTAYGRWRRCSQVSERSQISDQERQFQNFPIQGSVADAVSIAVFNLLQYRNHHYEFDYRLLLQIHDALLFEVPIAQAPLFISQVLPKCMCEDVPFWPRRMDGSYMPVAQPYRFGIDTEVFINWGDPITPEDAARYALPPELLHH